LDGREAIRVAVKRSLMLMHRANLMNVDTISPPREVRAEDCSLLGYPARRTAFVLLAAAFIISRLLYFAWGVRFDADPLNLYWQYIDPQLLRTDFWRSLFYLEQQPPGFNFFLGGVLHLFPKREAIAFQFVYLALGLALALSLFDLMDRMGVDRRFAVAVALVFTLSPSTVLYENLLFYEYPLTLLLCVAALFLHRLAAGGRLRDALVFFSAIACVALIRSVFHVVWYCAIVLLLGFALRRWRRRIAQAAAVPGLLLAAFYVKHFVVFHTLVPGGSVYLGINWTTMITYPVPRASIERLTETGRITPLLRTGIFHLGEDFRKDAAKSSIAAIVPVPAKTGIPVRDECKKSTYEFNWNCAWAQRVARAYLHDSLVVFQSYPGEYFKSVAYNLSQYFLPDAENWPFDGRNDGANQRILSQPLATYNLLTTGEWPPAITVPWLAYIALPLLFGYGLFEGLSRLRSGGADDRFVSSAWASTTEADDKKRSSAPLGALQRASHLTLMFMVGNIAYLSAIVVLLSEADQNRYRTEVSTYFAVLLGLALTRILRRLANRPIARES
jgi:hypothetical protein